VSVALAPASATHHHRFSPEQPGGLCLNDTTDTCAVPTILADPPWDIQQRAPVGLSATIPHDPGRVRASTSRASRPTIAHLWLWVTQRHHRAGQSSCSRGAFSYRSCLTWIKRGSASGLPPQPDGTLVARRCAARSDAVSAAKGHGSTPAPGAQPQTRRAVRDHRALLAGPYLECSPGGDGRWGRPGATRSRATVQV